MIEAIFFSRFHPERGPIVIHQVPEGAILQSPASHATPLFDFQTLAEFIIPRQEFCDAALSVSAGPHRIVGHPTLISSPRYARNEFIFNLAVVIPSNVDAVPYARVVRRVSQLLREAELNECFLSEDEASYDATSVWSPEPSLFGSQSDAVFCATSRVHAFCEMIMQDLNSYGQTMLPIDTSRVLNATLESGRGNLPCVRSWHVPLAVQDLGEWASQLAIGAVGPLIDGKRSVAQIAQAANADLSVVQKVVARLAVANAVKLLDIFQYGAKYATCPGIRRMLHSTAVRDLAAAAIAQPGAVIHSGHIPALYATFGNGTSLQGWCLEHWSKLDGIDIRQLVVWGVLQGFLYRVHQYAISPSCDKADEGPKLDSITAALSELPLERYLHGLHCLDCICTAHTISPVDAATQLRAMSGTVLIEK